MLRAPILQHRERILFQGNRVRNAPVCLAFQHQQLVALLAAGVRRRNVAQCDEEPEGNVFGHSSMELASYGHSSRPKVFIGMWLGICKESYFFGHTQWRRARKNKRTAHGGKAAVAASLSGADRRDAYGWTGRQDVSPTNSRRSRLHLSICVSRMHLFFGSFVGVSTNRHAVLPEGLYILHPSSFILHPSSFVLRPPLSRLGSPGALFRGKIGKARVEQTEERN